MRVRCQRILYPVDGPEGPVERETSEHPAVTVGKEYIVHQLLFMPGQELEVAILDDDSNGTGSQWPVRMFATTDERIPSNFGIRIYDDGRVQIAPRSWLRDYFWEEVKQSPGSTRAEILAAIADYRRELDVILRES